MFLIRISSILILVSFYHTYIVSLWSSVNNTDQKYSSYTEKQLKLKILWLVLPWLIFQLVLLLLILLLWLKTIIVMCDQGIRQCKFLKVKFDLPTISLNDRVSISGKMGSPKQMYGISGFVYSLFFIFNSLFTDGHRLLVELVVMKIN